MSEVAVLDTAGESAGPAMGALHFFLDIDSTLAGPRSKIIQNKVRGVLGKMLKDGHGTYLASGRHSEQVNVDIRHYGAERLGISENGGMTASPDGSTRLGDRSEPDEVMHYMKMNHRQIVEYIPQGMRVTGRIFRKSVPEKEFKKYVKESGAAVDVLASKTSYHVAKRGVNKGSAIERPKTDLVFNEYDIAVGVGDSGLDVPMFRESDWSFAVHNATRLAKKSASVVQGGDYGDAIAEMYDTWLSRGLGRRRTAGGTAPRRGGDRSSGFRRGKPHPDRGAGAAATAARRQPPRARPFPAVLQPPPHAQPRRLIWGASAGGACGLPSTRGTG